MLLSPLQRNKLGSLLVADPEYTLEQVLAPLAPIVASKRAREMIVFALCDSQDGKYRCDSQDGKYRSAALFTAVLLDVAPALFDSEPLLQWAIKMEGASAHKRWTMDDCKWVNFRKGGYRKRMVGWSRRAGLNPQQVEFLKRAPDYPRLFGPLTPARLGRVSVDLLIGAYRLPLHKRDT